MVTAPVNELVPLRVLIANERRDRLELLAQVVTGLGHEVIAREVDVTAVAAVTRGNAQMSRSSGSGCPRNTRSS